MRGPPLVRFWSSLADQFGGPICGRCRGRRRFVTLRIFRPSPTARRVADEMGDTAHRRATAALRPAAGFA